MTATVSIIIGSDSDMNLAKKCSETLDSLSIDNSINVYSAHRSPELVAEHLKACEEGGTKVFIAMAGMLLAFDLSTWTSILYSAITIGLTTVIMWWFWAIWSIRTIGESMEDAHKTIEQVRKELKLARKEMKEMPFDR